MIREALDRLITLGQEAQKPIPVDVGDRNKVAFSIGGKIVAYDRSVDPRSHIVTTTEGFVELVNRFENASVWYDHGGIVAVLDDSVRRDRAYLPFRTSDKWGSVSALSGARWFEHKEFIRFLRVDLAGVLPASHLLDKIRKVKFENQAVVASEVRKDRESMGKEIASRTALEEGDIPDEVRIVTPMYVNPGLEELEYVVECNLEVDAARGQFRLAPKPDEIDNARQLAMDSVGEILRDRLTTTLIYQGRAD